MNKMCQNIVICNHSTCTPRQTKTCQTFEDLGKRKFASSAYRHISNRTNHKVECLEKVVEELKVEIVKLGQNIKEADIQQIELLDTDILLLKKANADSGQTRSKLDL